METGIYAAPAVKGLIVKNDYNRFLLMFDPKSDKMSNFHSLEVVGRGSEPQLQVGEKC